MWREGLEGGLDNWVFQSTGLDRETGTQRRAGESETYGSPIDLKR